VDVGVTVDTTGSAWSGDTDLYVDMDLASSKLLTTGVKLTIEGDFQDQELQLQGAANNTWQLDTDESRPIDELTLYAQIGSSPGSTPGDITGATNIITTSAKRAGQPQVNEVPADETSHVFEFLSTDGPRYADVDHMAVNAVRRLWLKAMTPVLTSTSEEQQFTVTVTALTGPGL